MKPKAQILLVDDHPLVRERLGQLIGQQPDLAVCGECEDAAQCMKMLESAKPDLLIVDLALKNAHGIELIKEVKNLKPEMRMLVLTMHDELVFAERALRAGAMGYVTKQEPTDTIMAAIRRVLAGEIYLPERMAAQLVSLLIRGPKISTGPLIGSLSDRELEIFQMMGDGLTTRQIADNLSLDVKTVETYRGRLKDKLQLDTTAELLHHAVHWAQNNHKP